jgi:hypothetical protein
MSKIQVDDDLWLCTRYYQCGWISENGHDRVMARSEKANRGFKLAAKMGLIESSSTSSNQYIFTTLTPLGIAMLKMLQ